MIKDFFVGLVGFLFVGALALVVIGAVGGAFVGGVQLADGAVNGGFDPLDFSAVGTRSTAIPAVPAAFEPIAGPSATPTAYTPPAAAPAEAAAAPTSGVLITSSVSTKFYYEVDGAKYDIRPGTYLLLEFEQEGTGNEGWYGVLYLGQKGFVRMYEFDLPEGIYTQEDLRDLIPWGQWPQN